MKCPKCKSEIAVDNRTIWTIDCDCGQEVTIDNAIWEKGEKEPFKDTKESKRDLIK